MKRFVKIIDSLSDWVGIFVAWLIIPLVGALVFEVAARYIFNAPTIWAYDMSYLLCGTLFIMGVAYTLRHKGHVRVDIFFEKLSPRGKSILDTCMYLLVFFPLVIVFFWWGIDYARESWRIQETAWLSSWRPPLYHFKTIIPIAALLMILQGMAEFIRQIHFAVRGKQLGE